MTIDVYPAKVSDNLVEHADDWSEDSTMNMANGNFYHFFGELLGDQNVQGLPGMWKTKFIADALRMNTKNLPSHYVSKLTRIVAQAEILKPQSGVHRLCLKSSSTSSWSHLHRPMITFRTTQSLWEPILKQNTAWMPRTGLMNTKAHSTVISGVCL
jgi:hypothetical protein